MRTVTRLSFYIHPCFFNCVIFLISLIVKYVGRVQKRTIAAGTCSSWLISIVLYQGMISWSCSKASLLCGTSVFLLFCPRPPIQVFMQSHVVEKWWCPCWQRGACSARCGRAVETFVNTKKADLVALTAKWSARSKASLEAKLKNAFSNICWLKCRYSFELVCSGIACCSFTVHSCLLGIAS